MGRPAINPDVISTLYAGLQTPDPGEASRSGRAALPDPRPRPDPAARAAPGHGHSAGHQGPPRGLRPQDSPAGLLHLKAGPGNTSGALSALWSKLGISWTRAFVLS